jgi:uncharacterized protein involved in exopolysaccharide biosynthesis
MEIGDDTSPARDELARLAANHAELQRHQQTLRRQLTAKTAQAKQLQAAVAECRALLRAASSSTSSSSAAKDVTADSMGPD